MFKLAMALLGSAAVLATPVAASAQHISSPTSTLVLKGPASLGTDDCELTLTVNLTEKGGHTSPPLWDSGTVVSGTNTPNPSPNCPGITLTGGDFDVTSSGVQVNNLVINGACNTGPFTGTITNLTGKIELDVPPGTTTPCGPIEALLESISPSGVQLVP